MRILQINVRIDSGSVGRIVQDLYRGITNAGHTCKIAYARGGIGNVPEEDTIRICSEFEVKKHALLTRAFGNTAFYSHKSTVEFLKKVEAYKPDIIHIHGVYGYYINMRDLFEYIADNNIKLVSTLHSCWDFTGHCCHFTYIGCEQWKTLCKKCPQKSSYPKSSFLDNTEKNYNKKKKLYTGINDCIIVTPSKWLAGLAKESFLNTHKIITIENGVDTDVFKRVSAARIGYGIDQSKPIILCIANIWSPKKGWNDVVELSEILSKERNEIQLVIVGVTEKEKKQIGSKAVCITRTTDVKELAEIYNISTVLFNPTYEDTYPTVNIEAIACGTPVITYDTCGSPEAVKHFQMGEIIDKKDYKKLITLTNYYFANKTCKQDYSLELSYKRATNRYLDVYKSFVNGG